MKTKMVLITGLLLLMAVFGFLLYKAIENSAAFYYTLAELSDPDLMGKQVRVKGRLLKESVRYQPELPRLTFTVSDGEYQAEMVYLEVMPDNFNHISEVIAEGKVRGEQFQVSKLMLQCPSKYENQSDEDGGEE